MAARARAISKTAHVHPERRIRLFVTTESDGRPGSGVPFRLFFSTSDEGREQGPAYNVGLFESDAAGYLSIPAPSPNKVVPHAEHAPRAPSLIIEALDRSDLRWTLGEGQEVFHFAVPDALARNRGHVPVYPSVPHPDVRDWELSPASFCNHTSVPVVGEDGCEVLLHNTYPETIFRFAEIYREPGAPATLGIAGVAPCEGTPNEFPESRCIRRGAILEYEIQWSPCGHSLGEIVYSSTLGPCEQVNLAIIDWSREDVATRADVADTSEALVHDLRRERLVEETTKFAIRERQHGGSVMGAIGGALSAASFGLAGGMGGGYATTSGRRSGSARGTQSLADHVAQAASNMRSLRQTVVVEASAREQNVLQTRTIRNHNHCHALTMLYYEILRHYQVTVTVVEKSDVILVALPSKLQSREFTIEDLSRYRWVLEPALLDRGLARCFDEVGKSAGKGVSSPSAPAGTRGEVARFVVEVTTGTDGAHPDVFFFITMADGSQIDFDQLDTPRPHDDFMPGATDRFERPGNGVRIEDVRGVGIRFRDGHRSWDFKGLRVRYAVSGSSELFTLYENPAINKHFDQEEDWADAAEVTSEAPLPAPEVESCAQRLVDHLNAHFDYYSTVLWINGDPNDSVRILDAYAYTHVDESGRRVEGRLADFIDPQPVGSSGSYVAFHIDSAEFAQSIETPPPVHRMVSLPTPGVFAELKLSNCSGCERVDATRFWDWQESPCLDAAPALAPVVQTQGQARPDLTPAAVPGATLEVAPAPEAPALGQLLQGVLDVMKTPEIFRDMSAKEQVAGLVQAAIAGSVEVNKAQLELEKAKVEAERAKAELEMAKMEKEEAREGAGNRVPPRTSAEHPTTRTRQTPGQEARDQHSILRALEREGSISREQAAESHQQVQEAVGERISGRPRPAQRPPAAGILSPKVFRFRFHNGAPMFGWWRMTLEPAIAGPEIDPETSELSSSPRRMQGFDERPEFPIIGDRLSVTFPHYADIGRGPIRIHTSGTLYQYRSLEMVEAYRRLGDEAVAAGLYSGLSDLPAHWFDSGWIPRQHYAGELEVSSECFRRCQSFEVRLPQETRTVSVTTTIEEGEDTGGTLSFNVGKEVLDAALSITHTATSRESESRTVEHVEINLIPREARLTITAPHCPECSNGAGLP